MMAVRVPLKTATGCEAIHISAAEVKRSYATASIVAADRIVFNIKGNDYRLVAASISRKVSCGSSGSARTGTTTG
jgi:mRNA-degrading endonuclease HigB of HigAB toxin-antitoxin module